jgi:hypothetical protein
VRRYTLCLALAALAVGVGCSTSPRRGPYNPPRKIDWKDPVSVVRAFFSAKRAGDWQTAYRCCDYEETLSREERDAIKKKWKEECKRWPRDYADTSWIPTGRRYERDAATVAIMVSHRDPITRRLQPTITYEEKLKRYNGKWKITYLLAEESSE